MAGRPTAVSSAIVDAPLRQITRTADRQTGGNVVEERRDLP